MPMRKAHARPGRPSRIKPSGSPSSRREDRAVRRPEYGRPQCALLGHWGARAVVRAAPRCTRPRRGHPGSAGAVPLGRSRRRADGRAHLSAGPAAGGWLPGPGRRAIPGGAAAWHRHGAPDPRRRRWWLPRPARMRSLSASTPSWAGSSGRPAAGAGVRFTQAKWGVDESVRGAPDGAPNWGGPSVKP